MLQAIRNASRRVFQALAARGQSDEVQLVKRQKEADAYGRVHAVGEETLSVPAIVMAHSGVLRIQAEDGTWLTIDLVLLLDTSVEFNLLDDLFQIEPFRYRVVRVLVDGSGAYQHLYCKQIT